MMASRFLCLFWLWLLASLKTSPNRLHFVRLTRWLAFQRRASRSFLYLEFNIQISAEEVEGSASKAEVDAGSQVFSGAPDRAPFPSDSRVPPWLILLLRLLGLRFLNPLLPQAGAQRQAFRIFFLSFFLFGVS